MWIGGKNLGVEFPFFTLKLITKYMQILNVPECLPSTKVVYTCSSLHSGRNYVFTTYKECKKYMKGEC